MVTVPARVPADMPHPWRGQLETNAPTERSDCVVVSTIYQVKIASDNKVGPVSASEWRAWVTAVRRAMGRPAGACKPTDAMRAWRSAWMRGKFRAAGLELPSVSLLSGARWELGRDHLRLGRSMALFVSYGVLRQGDAPAAVTAFAGGHALVVNGWLVSDELAYTNDLDPLFDGTPRGTPDGPQVARMYDLRAAAGAFGRKPWGAGRFTGISVRPAKALPVPDMVARLRSIEAQAIALLADVRAVIASMEDPNGG